jgi:antitoxin (DNA-binding transcriptional repressor) of toxin-antitoxin stability system
MKISISEARRRLPELVRQVRKYAGRSVQITVHDEVVAELRSALEVTNCDLHSANSSGVMINMKSSGNRPMFLLTACFSAFVGTP